MAGISKQSVHQYKGRTEEYERKIALLLVEADILRSEHPGCGVEKMYYTLQPDWIGRDRFIEIMMGMGYRIKKIRSFYKNYNSCILQIPKPDRRNDIMG